jgi:hypothetical protein
LVINHVVVDVLTKLKFHQDHCVLVGSLVGDDFIQGVYKPPGGLAVTHPLLAPVFY